jgi:ribose transport system permease protein
MTGADVKIARPELLTIGRAGIAGLVGRRQFALTVVAVAMFAFFSLRANYFFTSDNLIDIARASAYTVIVGVAITFLMISGEIDLSVGSLFGLSAVVMGLLVANTGMNPWAAALAVVLVGALVGAVNGLVTVVGGVPSFIVTLGSYSLLRGLALVLTGGEAVPFPEGVGASFQKVVAGSVFGVPAQVLWALGIAGLGGFALKHTRFGAHVYASGGNERAASSMGIATARCKLMCFIMTGAACGLVGALQTGWLSAGDPTTGNGFELQVIAAAIIGGLALTGGDGSVYGTVLGVTIVGMLSSGLVLMGAPGNWVQVLVGALIITVALLEVLVRRRGSTRERLRALVR